MWLCARGRSILGPAPHVAGKLDALASYDFGLLHSGTTKGRVRADEMSRLRRLLLFTSLDCPQVTGFVRTQLARSLRLWEQMQTLPAGNTSMQETPQAPTFSEEGVRPVTPCQNCKIASVTAVVLAHDFVYLRCASCARVTVIEERRSAVRPGFEGQIFPW
jgi:hypothetical protein